MKWAHLMTIGLFALVLGFLATSAGADPIRIDPFAKTIERQRDDNKRWEKEAKAKESEWSKIAEEYYKAKEFGKAKDYYDKILDLRYEQWDFPDRDGGKQMPARDKKEHALSTSYTRRARLRYKQMGEEINTEKLKELMEEAEIAAVLEEPAEAYKIYEDIIEEVEEIGREKYAITFYKKAKSEQEKLAKAPSAALDEIKKLVESKKVKEAEEKLKAFEEQYGDFLEVSSDFSERFESLGGKPIFVEEAKKRRISQQIRLGDAAFERKDYGTAYRHYSAVVARYKGTESQKIVAEKLAKMLADPEIKEAMKQQEAEEQCQLLVYRARGFRRMGRLEDAKMSCEKVIIDFPDSKWVREAVKILEEIDREETAGANKDNAEENKDSAEENKDNIEENKDSAEEDKGNAEENKEAQE